MGFCTPSCREVHAHCLLPSQRLACLQLGKPMSSLIAMQCAGICFLWTMPGEVGIQTMSHAYQMNI